MKYTAWIWIPAVKGEFEITQQTNDKGEAMHWLAGQVGKHPESERYGVTDNDTLETVHKSGAM
jgi:hypothetical protein